MRLSPAPPTYDREDAQLMRKALESADMANFKKGQDLRLQRSERLILASPNGTLYYLTVTNAGVLGTTAV